MVDRSIADGRDVYRWWSQLVAGAVQRHCQLLDAQWEAGFKILCALANSFPVRGGVPVASGSFTDLVHVARERVRAGLPPPREIYEVHNRGRVDWAQFPEWARPSDPELFEGGHEG